jgi:short-subunit dehydrogenase
MSKTTFQHKVVWITGASSGIGRALAVELSHEVGVQLVLSARKESALEEVAQECRANGASTVLKPLDLAANDQLEQKAQEVVTETGRIDILVNNGGLSQRSLAHETTIEVDQLLMNVNYLGTVALTKAVLPCMRKRGEGHIAVISSVVGKFGTPHRSGYSASKHALHGFFDSLRAEVEDEGIAVSIICPGFIRTNVTLNALTNDGSKLNRMDTATNKGLPAKKCAAQIVQALKKQKREVYIGNREIVGVYLNRFFPGLFAWYLKRAKVR